jgi:hypothetical protein
MIRRERAKSSERSNRQVLQSSPGNSFKLFAIPPDLYRLIHLYFVVIDPIEKRIEL